MKLEGWLCRDDNGEMVAYTEPLKDSVGMWSGDVWDGDEVLEMMGPGCHGLRKGRKKRMVFDIE